MVSLLGKLFGRLPQTSSELLPLEEFQDLLSATPTADRARMEPSDEEIAGYIATAAGLALAHPGLVAGSAHDTLAAMIGHLDRQLSVQMSLITQDPAFQALESAWLGLDYLVRNAASRPDLVVQALNITAGELEWALAAFPGGQWRQSPVHGLLFERVYGPPGAPPVATLVVDAAFDHSQSTMLRVLARICAASQTPMLAGASPNLFGLEDLGDLPGLDDLEAVFAAPDYDAWNDLRQSDDSRYLALCLPRILARPPYGADNPAEGFDFRERGRFGGDPEPAWINPAFAMAVNIIRAVELSGWAVDIRGVSAGGEIVRVADWPFPEGEGAEPPCPLEIVIDERRESRLARLGLLPAIHRKGTDRAAFIGAQSLNRPDAQGGEDDLPMRNILARLPYLLFTTRYAHYVMRMAADWREPLAGAGARRFEDRIRDWFAQYIDPAPWETNAEGQARRPLQAVAFEMAGDGGLAVLEMIPGFRLEGLGYPLRVTVALPRGDRT